MGLPTGGHTPWHHSGRDYELDIDDQGRTHAVWGEGLNYNSPGSIWYTNGR